MKRKELIKTFYDDFEKKTIDLYGLYSNISAIFGLRLHNSTAASETAVSRSSCYYCLR